MKLSTTIKLIFFTTILSISTASFAFPDISGNWKCSGYDPFIKKNFTLSGEIQKSGDTYNLVNWQNDETGEQRRGTGIHYDKFGNSFSAIFWSENSPAQVGFGLFKVTSKNKIVGTWTIKNGTMVAEETCRRI